MSFNPKPNKPDSPEVAKLRAAYEKKVREARITKDPLAADDLKQEKAELFAKVVEQQTAERRQQVADFKAGVVVAEKPEATEAAGGGKSPVADLTAPEAIEKIGNMRSKDHVQEIIDNDTRSTVKDAAQKKLASMG